MTTPSLWAEDAHVLGLLGSLIRPEAYLGPIEIDLTENTIDMAPARLARATQELDLPTVAEYRAAMRGYQAQVNAGEKPERPFPMPVVEMVDGKYVLFLGRHRVTGWTSDTNEDGLKWSPIGPTIPAMLFEPIDSERTILLWQGNQGADHRSLRELKDDAWANRVRAYISLSPGPGRKKHPMGSSFSPQATHAKDMMKFLGLDDPTEVVKLARDYGFSPASASGHLWCVGHTIRSAAERGVEGFFELVSLGGKTTFFRNQLDGIPNKDREAFIRQVLAERDAQKGRPKGPTVQCKCACGFPFRHPAE